MSDATHPAVSILMPSLNVGPYIEECLHSVITQTLADIEVICIDAGSTDGTLEVLRAYEERDPRVRVIVSDKKSYGHQMNLGLDAARGTYVGVVETDDWVEPHMFATLLQLAQDYDADVVRSNFYLYYSKPEPRDELFQNMRRCEYDTLLNPWDELGFVSSSPAIWSGLYRRSMLVDAHIRFNETPGASYQDTSFFFLVCAVAQRAVVTEEAFVHYRQDNEASSINSASKAFCICDETRYFEQCLEERGLDTTERMGRYMLLKQDKYRWNYMRVSPALQWEFLLRARDEYLAHRAQGLLSDAYLSEARMQRLTSLMDDPAGFFDATCKQYGGRPADDELPAELAPAATTPVRAAYAAVLQAQEALGTACALAWSDGTGAAGAADAAAQALVAAHAQWRALDRKERRAFAERLLPTERLVLQASLGYVRDERIAEMLAPLRSPVAKRAAHVVTYPVRKARAIVRSRKK